MTDGAETPVLGEDEVRTIAKLAHLDLSPEDVQRMTRELGGILTYVKQLEQLELTDVPPTTSTLSDALLPPLRKDEPIESLPRELAVREAPEVQDDGFAVPAFVDEG